MNSRSLKTIFVKSKKAPGPAATEFGGFTLVELLVAMAVASIMLAAVVSLFATLNRSYTRQNVAAEVQQVARAGVDFIAQSIRMAGLDPEQTDDFGIDGSSDNDSITFRADLNLNGERDDASELIRYYLDGSQVKQSINGSDVALVDNVTDLTFTYLAADNSILATPVADPDAVRTVRIALTVREPAGKGEPVARTYATEVRCRNLGL